jgi:hypothetical protein
MNHQINTSVIINAKSSTVWKVLTAFERYSEWNPFIKSIQGKIEVGTKFHAEIDTMKFKPTTLVYDENKEFTWLGQLILPGIFDGKHSFILQDNNDGTTTLIQKESFKGILVRFMKKKLDNDILNKFKQMNDKLKEIAEKEYH